MYQVMNGSLKRDQAQHYMDQMVAVGIADIDTNGFTIPGIFAGAGNSGGISWIPVIAFGVGIGVGYLLSQRI